MAGKMKVPDGWRIVRLGDVADVNRGASWSRAQESSVPMDDAIPVVRIGNVQHDGFRMDDVLYIRGVSASEKSRGSIAHRTLVMVGSNGNRDRVGNIFLADQQLLGHLLASFLIGIALVVGISERFLAGSLRSAQIQSFITESTAGSTGLKNLSLTWLRNLPILLPPLLEQRAIAAVLDSIDDAIERTEAVITATERLRDALLQELLTRGVPGWHTQWKDVPGIGTIPAAWEVVRLGEIYEVQLGKMLSPKARQGKNPRPYLTNRNVRWGKFDLSDLPTMDFDRREIEKFQLRPGDLLVCEGGDTGRAAVWLGEIADCYYQKALHRLRPIDENAISEFMLAVLMSYATKGILLEHSERTSISHLTRERLLRMRIPHSSRAEQDEIVAALGCVADSIRWAREEQDRIQTLKSSVAAALLMGRVRVDRLGR